MPIDARAQTESAEVGNEAADSRIGIAAKFDRAQRQLGFGVGADSPYSALAENAQQYKSTERGIGTRAGNQLYSGATLNAHSAARSTYDKNQQEIADRISEAQNEHDTGLASTARTEATGLLGAKAGAVERRVASEPQPLAPGARRGRGRTAPGQPRQRINRRRGRI